MSASEIINALKGLSGVKFFEVYKKSTFKCHRNKKNGDVQTVTVDVFDGGAEAGENRYHCVATSDDGAEATGNPAGTIEVVFATLHWNKLDP